MAADTETGPAFSSLMPFMGKLGARLVRNEPDEVQARLDWSEDLCTSGGVMHGGVIMALADSTGAACAVHHLPAGAGTSTIESKTNFLRAVRGGHVLATSRPLHAGRTVIVVETDVTDADGRRVARVTQTQAVLQARPEG
jgi:1,4-dihydroxy-2-naphthoyl-CoA hydrolase